MATCGMAIGTPPSTSGAPKVAHGVGEKRLGKGLRESHFHITKYNSFINKWIINRSKMDHKRISERTHWVKETEVQEIQEKVDKLKE